MKINQDGVDITKRFFNVIQLLKDQGRLNLYSYSTTYDINRWNLITIRDNPSISVLKPEYLVPLVNDFEVSAEWLLTGKGKIFKY